MGREEGLLWESCNRTEYKSRETKTENRKRDECPHLESQPCVADLSPCLIQILWVNRVTKMEMG